MADLAWSLNTNRVTNLEKKLLGKNLTDKIGLGHQWIPESGHLRTQIKKHRTNEWDRAKSCKRMEHLTEEKIMRDQFIEANFLY
jgi:hypothetical protein